MVSKEVLKKVVSQVMRKFPELKGVEPVIDEVVTGAGDSVIASLARIDRKLVATLQKSKSAVKVKQDRIFVARFETEVLTQKGDRIKKIIKVSFSKNGGILKTVVSK